MYSRKIQRYFVKIAAFKQTKGLDFMYLHSSDNKNALLFIDTKEISLLRDTKKLSDERTFSLLVAQGHIYEVLAILRFELLY